MGPIVKTMRNQLKRSVSQLAHHYLIPDTGSATNQAMDQSTRKRNKKKFNNIL